MQLHVSIPLNMASLCLCRCALNLRPVCAQFDEESTHLSLQLARKAEHATTVTQRQQMQQLWLGVAELRQSSQLLNQQLHQCWQQMYGQHRRLWHLQ